MAKIDRMTGREFADKHEEGLRGALETMIEGAKAVEESPGKKAKANKDKWIKKLQMKETQDKWERNVDYDKDFWAKRFEEKTRERLDSGLRASRDIRERFGEQLIGFIKSARRKHKETHKVLTLEDAARSASDWVKTMGKFRFEKTK